MANNDGRASSVTSRWTVTPEVSGAQSEAPTESYPDDDTFLTVAQSTSRVGLWIWDLGMGSIWRSTELYRLHGVGAGALGDSFEDYLKFVHPDDRPRVMETAAAAATGDTVPVEYRFVHPEAGVRHFLGHSALVRDPSGHAQRLVGTVQDTTEVHRAKKSVSDAFSRLSAYFEEAPTPAYLWVAQGDDLVLQRFNRAARERWSELVPEFTGMRASDLAREHPEVAGDLWACLRGQNAITREIDFRSDALGLRRLVLTYVPVASDAIVAHVQDISELLAVAEREEQAIKRLAQYFQRVPSPAYLWRGVDGHIVLEAANDAASQQTGDQLDRFIGITARDMYTDRSDIREDLERAAVGETFTREYPYRMKSTGEDKELVVTYVHIPPSTVVAHTEEVTEQRRMEGRLRESHERAHGIMEGNPDGICLIVGGEITACNGSLSTLLGCSKQQVIGRRLHDLMIPEDRSRARERGRQILEGGASEPSQYTLLRCDGSRLPVEIYAAAFPFRGTPALVCTLRDITKRKASERELAHSRDALRALIQHLEEVRELERLQVARDLHDELGSVLTALKIDLEELRSGDLAGEGERGELLETMADLVDQAIEVGRRVTSRLRPGILDDLGLAAATEWLGADLERRTGIRCEVVLPEVEPELTEPVATTMFRILQEALTNVIRHAEADSVRVALEADETSVSLSVSDTGKGFDPDHVQSAGFGLLGMRERVRSFDGTLDVSSRPGQGTKIHVALPRSARGI